MKSVYHKFKISDVISIYQQKMREQYRNNGFEGDPDFSSVYFEPKQKEHFRKDKNGHKISCGKTVFINLDALIENLIEKYDIQNGYVIASSDHTTSSVYINHFETGMMTDLHKHIDKTFPFNPKKYLHNKWDDEFVNGAAHLKAITMGKSAMAFIVNKKLYLGKFEDVVYAEFDYRPDKTFTIALYWEEDAPAAGTAETVSKTKKTTSKKKDVNNEAK